MQSPWNRSSRLAALAALSISLTASPALAADRPRPPRPPQEAFTACADKAAGDACEATFGDRTVSGTCAATPDGALACHPARPPGHRPPHGPPAEAVEACAGEADGAACAVTLDGNTLDGTCVKGPGGEPAACRPDGMPPPPEE